MGAKSDSYLESLYLRIANLEGRLEKVEKYRATEPSKLNREQHQLLAECTKWEGRLEEAKFQVDKYKKNAELTAEQKEKELAAALEQAKTEATAEFSANLKLVSSLLYFMSSQYKAGKSLWEDRQLYAFYNLLEQFYAGDTEGGNAMEKFINGVNESVCENGVLFSELKSCLVNAITNPQVEPEVQSMAKDSTQLQPESSVESAPLEKQKQYKSSAKPVKNGRNIPTLGKPEQHDMTESPRSAEAATSRHDSVELEGNTSGKLKEKEKGKGMNSRNKSRKKVGKAKDKPQGKAPDGNGK